MRNFPISERTLEISPQALAQRQVLHTEIPVHASSSTFGDMIRIGVRTTIDALQVAIPIGPASHVVLSVPIDTYMRGVRLSHRDMLTLLHDDISRQLAKIALEETP